MPCNYRKYPPDWKAIRARILARARNRCEQCGVKNYAAGWRDGDGEFHQTYGNLIHDAAGNGELSYSEAAELVDHANSCEGLGLDGERGIVIVLTIAHTCEDGPGCGKEDHLKALCQRCHIRLDRDLHVRNARATRMRKQRERQPELFT